MKKTTAVIISSVLGLSLLAVAPAFADQGQQGPGGSTMRIWGHASLQQGQGGEQENQNEDKGGPGPGMMGRPLQGLMGLIRGRGEMMGRSFGGKVTAVSSPNFTLELPATPREATTTINVVTNASTTFMLGKTNASVSDVAVGDFALVAGPYASSTQTLTALRVNLSTTTPGRGQEVRIEVRDAISEHMDGGFGTSTPREFVKGVMNSILQGFARFFHR